jgi:hypothetical protein
MKHEEFIKLTKKEKLALPVCDVFRIANVEVALFIPVKTKNCGYSMNALFLKTQDKWTRAPDYDCFRFINGNRMIKGDFEHGGMQFFGLGNAVWEYGNEINLNI